MAEGSAEWHWAANPGPTEEFGVSYKATGLAQASSPAQLIFLSTLLPAPDKAAGRGEGSPPSVLSAQPRLKALVLGIKCNGLVWACHPKLQ